MRQFFAAQSLSMPRSISNAPLKPQLFHSHWFFFLQIEGHTVNIADGDRVILRDYLLSNVERGILCYAHHPNTIHELKHEIEVANAIIENHTIENVLKFGEQN